MFPSCRNESIDLLYKWYGNDIEETLVFGWLKEIAAVNSSRVSEAATRGALLKKPVLKNSAIHMKTTLLEPPFNKVKGL